MKVRAGTVVKRITNSLFSKDTFFGIVMFSLHSLKQSVKFCIFCGFTHKSKQSNICWLLTKGIKVIVAVGIYLTILLYKDMQFVLHKEKIVKYTVNKKLFFI